MFFTCNDFFIKDYLHVMSNLLTLLLRLNNNKTFDIMKDLKTKDQLIKQANDWYNQFQDNPVVFITEDGESDLYWHRQQSIPDNTVWSYNGRTKEEFTW